MKIQYLAVIFIIIIMPITIVFNEYINNQLTTIKTEQTYDTRLLNATHDAIKAFQLNTINNGISDISNSKISDIEAATTTFFNSLSTGFKYTGYKADIMKEYVPAVVFTMYDGYYIYSPFINTLTTIQDKNGDPVLNSRKPTNSGDPEPDVDIENYPNNETLDGLKPYVYYNCRYTKGTNYDFTITYTLDNYITIEGIIDGDYVYDYGYLIDGITKSGENYIYDGITFTSGDTEVMKEYVGNKEYYYVKINGTKYYYDDGNTAGNMEDDIIFYITSSGVFRTQVPYKNNEEKFMLYYNAIMNNQSSYQYYKEAYEFTDRVRNGGTGKYNFSNLTDCVAQVTRYDSSGNATIVNNYYTNNSIAEIFSAETGKYIQDSNSKFNMHRSEVIRNVIETNLSAAISGFSTYSDATTSEFIMPKISETDWELLENNVCVATFLQGMPIGGKVYNSYAVMPNTLTKEYIDEDDIYILTNDGTYCKANDNNLLNGTETIKQKTNNSKYYAGVWKLNFERKTYYAQTDGDTSIYYYPLSYKNASGAVKPYVGSYTSIVGSSSNNSITYEDMYRYMRGSGVGASANKDNLKRAYYTGLARERYGSYKVNNDLKLKYFLKTYGDTSVLN